MKKRWPPAYFTDRNKLIFLFDIYYMAYLSSISYAVILLLMGVTEKLEMYFRLS